MDYLHSIILAVIQGLTEFLPVSSSGHIALTSAIYKLITGMDFSVAGDEEIFFDIMLHFGTLVAVCIYFKNELISIIKSFFKAVKTKNFDNYEAKLPLFIMLGTFFTCIVVLPIKDFCESLVSNPKIVSVLLIITGAILFISEFISKKFEQKSSQVDIKKSIFIGIAQGLAALPGISRSGSTIATALALGIDRTSAAKYSFLLSIPVILLAVVKKITEIAQPEILLSLNWVPIIVGTILSGIVGYFCIKYFIAFLGKFSLNIFAYYCMIVGFVMFWVW